MVTQLQEWISECEALQTSHIMSDDAIIQSVVSGEAEAIEDELQDLGDEDSDILVTDEVPNVKVQKCSNEELFRQLSWSLDQLTMRDWSNSKDSAELAQLVEKASKEAFKAKKQPKITSFFGFK